jgi:hypothetical protein
MILKEVEVSDLGDLIRGIVREEVSRLAPQPERDPEWVRRKEAQKLLGISAPTIISYEKKGYITPLRLGSTIFYKKNDLLSFRK